VSLSTKIYLACLVLLWGLGAAFLYASTWFVGQWAGYALLALGGMALVGGLVEYVVLPVLGIFRLGAIVRVTYYEALLQPFTLIVLTIGLLCIVAGAFLSFFTINEETKMYRDVATQFVLLFPLVIMVFAAGKVVDEEIENRTMLTLMSKPIARWQVIVGKYLGVVCLVAVAVIVLGLAAGTCAYLRYFDDQRIDLALAGKGPGRAALLWENQKAVLAMVPLMTLEFLQIATLAAISVAVSTRWGVALNMTVVSLIYVGANLTRYVHDLHMGSSTQWLLDQAANLLPYLANFDLSPVLIYGNFLCGKEDLANVTVTLAQIWQYVAWAGLYAVLYVGAALAIAVALFRTRELT